MGAKLFQALCREPKNITLVVSYAWGRKYQQSNQWVIETIVVAREAGAVSRDQAQAWLRRKSYQPTTLQLGPLTRLGAGVTCSQLGGAMQRVQ